MKWALRAGLPTIVGTLVIASGISAKEPASKLVAHLRGFQEVPVVSTVATGEFRGVIDPGGTSITFDFSYSGLQGTVTQAHIHVGQLSVNGGIVIWLCQTAAATGPAGTRTCSPGSDHFTGTITSANVVASTMPNQQIGAGEFDKVLAAIRAGKAYANVHSNLSPGGEIRGQIKVNGKNSNDDQDQDED